jgi:hypothetical protein
MRRILADSYRKNPRQSAFSAKSAVYPMYITRTITMPTPEPSPTPFIRPLDAPALTLADAGGKGANLNALVRAGLPVPPGFVVLTAAYRVFVAAHDLAPLIEAQWAALDQTSAAAFEQASAVLRAAFDAAPFPAELAAPILAAYAALGDGVAVAVRSSATAEDLPDASFAGQQDTYLNIDGADALLDAVKRCWGSLWTARAMAYRARQGILPAQVSLAVVVQVMAPATAAGVLFTVNPVTGAADEMLINATWGLGEALVSGRVNPDEIVADKATGRIKQSTVGEKAIMTASTGAGVAEVAVAAAQRKQLALTPDQVAELAQLGRDLEALFGQAQDVEWAIAGDRVVLLQSRPVTTIAPPAGLPGDDAWPTLDGLAAQPFDFWTQQDLGERWPDPVTPLTWSISEHMTQVSMANMVARLDAPYKDQIRWCKRAFGHVYLNEGALLYAYTHGYGMPISMIESGLTHPGARPPGAEKWRLGRVLRHLPWYWEVATGWARNVDRFEADFPKIDGWVDDFMARDLSEASDSDLLAEARDVWYARILVYIGYHTNATSLSMSALTQMESFLAKHNGDAGLAHTLAGGLSGVIAAEIAPDLWEMAQMLRAAGLDGVVAAQPPAAALATLRADPAAASFLARLQRFLQRHGHRCMVEAELLYPRWVEAPQQVIQSLGAYRDDDDCAGRHQRRRGAAPGGGDRTGDGAARLVPAQEFPADAGAAAPLHPPARQRPALRRQAAAAHAPPLCRTGAALGGARLAGGGDDIFFLMAEELTATVKTGDPVQAGLDLAANAAARRAAYTYWFTQPTPDALDAQGAGSQRRRRRRHPDRHGCQPRRRHRTGTRRADAGRGGPPATGRHSRHARHRPRLDAGLLDHRRRGAGDRRRALPRRHRRPRVWPAGGGQRAAGDAAHQGWPDDSGGRFTRAGHAIGVDRPQGECST